MDFPEPIVSADWLAEHIRDSGPNALRVIDVRWSLETGPQRAAYLDAHVPGAVFADLDTDLSDPAGSRGRHPLPDPARFAEARRRLGIDGRPVVVYDDRGGPVAARLWWMLDSIGIPVAVLEGGIGAWTGPLERGVVDAQLSEQPPIEPWPEERFIGADDVLDALASGAVLLDARSAERFEGKENEIDDRPGHIPGAASHPWTENLTEDGTFHSAEVLAARLRQHGVADDVELIASCGSGVTGCHNLLAARLAGFEGGRLYAGSWSEWSLDPERPIETGLS